MPSPYNQLTSNTRNTFVSDVAIEFRESSSASSNTKVGFGVSGSSDCKIYTASGAPCVVRNIKDGTTSDSVATKGYVDDLVFGITSKGVVQYATKDAEDSGISLPVTYTYSSGEAYLVSNGTMNWDQLTNNHIDIEHASIATAQSAGYFATHTPFVASIHEFYSTTDPSGSSRTNPKDWPTRIMVNNQTDPQQNGLYYLYQTQAPWKLKRLSKFDTAITDGEIKAGCFIFVTAGFKYANRGYVLRSDGTKSVLKIKTANAGDNIVFTPFSGAQTVTAGTNLVQAGGEISVDPNPVVTTAKIGAIDIGHITNVNGLSLPTVSTTHSSKTIYLGHTGLHSTGNITAQSLTSVDAFSAPSLAATSGSLSCGQGISPLFVANNSSLSNSVKIGNNGTLQLVNAAGAPFTTFSAANGEVKLLGSPLTCLKADQATPLLTVVGTGSASEQDTVSVRGNMKVGTSGSEVISTTGTGVTLSGLTVQQDSNVLFQDLNQNTRFSVQADKIKAELPLHATGLNIANGISTVLNVSGAGAISHSGTQSVTLLENTYTFSAGAMASTKPIIGKNGAQNCISIDPVNRDITTDKCSLHIKNGSIDVLKVTTDSSQTTQCRGSFSVASTSGTSCLSVNTTSPSVETTAPTTLNSRLYVKASQTDVVGQLSMRQTATGAAAVTIDPSAARVTSEGSVVVNDASAGSTATLTGTALIIGGNINISQDTATVGGNITLTSATGHISSNAIDAGTSLSAGPNGITVDIPASKMFEIKYAATTDVMSAGAEGLKVHRPTVYKSSTGVTTASIQAESGEFRGAAFLTASDVSLKKNIVDHRNGLNVIRKLRPVRFDWKDGPKHNTGFIAQELEAILPEAVSAVDEIKYVDQTKIIAHLVQAVQELEARL